MTEPSSHQDALLGRYLGPAREVYWGNPTLCAPYVNVGRKLLGYLKNTLGNSGIEVGSKHVLMPDGTKIVAHVDGVNHIIHIDVRERHGGEQRDISVFVETGWVNLENLTNWWVYPFTFSFVYYGTRQYAALSTHFPRWLDEIVISLDEIGRSSSFREGVVRVPHAPTHEDYPPQSYIESIGFQNIEDNEFNPPQFTRTRTAACSPSPGLATGRLKLYLQALLGGIGNKSYVLEKTGEVDSHSKTVSSIVRAIMGSGHHGNADIAFDWNYSRGIYVTDEYEYWLLSILGTNVYSQKLIPNLGSSLLRRSYLKTLTDGPISFLEKGKVESYILAGCLEFGPSILVGSNTLAEFMTGGNNGGSIGETVNEGWKFNYRGDEAQIVMDELVWNLNEGTGLMTQDYHVFRRYKLSFSYTGDDNQPFSVSLEKQEEVNATPEQKCLRPHKFPVLEGLGAVVEWQDWHELILGQQRGYLHGIIEYDAPLDGWYTRTDSGEESYITIRIIKKFADTVLTSSQVLSQYNTFIAGLTDDSFYGCASAGGSVSMRIEDYKFIDQIEAKDGFYVRVESGYHSPNIEEELLSPPQYFTYAVIIEDARIDVRPQSVHHSFAPSDYGGYLNLGFPSGQLACDGTYPSFPSNMVGGTGVSITTYLVNFESLLNSIGGPVTLSHTLVFPYGTGEGAYIQQRRYVNGARNYVYRFSKGPWGWEGVAHFSDGSTASYIFEARAILGYDIGPWWGSAGVSPSIPEYPEYNNPDIQINYYGSIHRSYSGSWAEREDQRKLFYVSSCNSELLFDETAHNKDQQVYQVYAFIDQFIYPAFGIDLDSCFGKHNWYVVNDTIEFHPWFDPFVGLIESYHGDAVTLQQWGPFEDGVAMPYQPIFHVTDNRYPLFDTTEDNGTYTMSRQFHSTFIGWA